jgi:hypothetical protein
VGWARYNESGAEALEPEMKRSPVKVLHVASKSASAWDWTMKYGKAPFSSVSHRGGILRGGQSARTIGPGLEFSLVLQLLSRKRMAYWLRESISKAILIPPRTLKP